MSNNPIPRKAVDLDSETIKALSIQAVYAGKSLKAYMENILMAKANKPGPRMIITLKGGLIECIAANQDIEYVIIDHDSKGEDNRPWKSDISQVDVIDGNLSLTQIII